MANTRSTDAVYKADNWPVKSVRLSQTNLTFSYSPRFASNSDECRQSFMGFVTTNMASQWRYYSGS